MTTNTASPATPATPVAASYEDAPRNPLVALWEHRHLLRRFTLNDALGKYKGSILGLCWSFLSPLLMLAVFTIAFGTIFQAGFGSSLPERPPVLPIFCGMIVFGVFGEVLGRAPAAILANPNYVKKVVFPLEILPIAILGSSLLHALIGLAMLLLGQLALGYPLYATTLLLPVVLLPLVLFAAGVGWFVAALGVYVRDITHSTVVVTQALFFLSPVVYPFQLIEDNRPSIAAVLALNPLKVAIDNARLVLIWGYQPDWTGLAICGALGIAVAWFGYLWFCKTRKGFADVV